MSLDTYTNLVAEVKDWLNRNDLTTAQCQTFVRLAEQDFNRHLRTRANEKQVSFTITTSATTYTIPSDLLEIKELNNTLSDAPPIERISLQDFKCFGAVDGGSTAWPLYFARDHDSLVFFPVTGDSTLSMTYWFSPTALSSSNETNEILTAEPDLYLWGSLAMAELFLRFDADALRFRPLYDNALATANGSNRSAEYSGSTVVIRNPYG